MESWTWKHGHMVIWMQPYRHAASGTIASHFRGFIEGDARLQLSGELGLRGYGIKAWVACLTCPTLGGFKHHHPRASPYMFLSWILLESLWLAPGKLGSTPVYYAHRLCCSTQPVSAFSAAGCWILLCTCPTLCMVQTQASKLRRSKANRCRLEEQL